MRIETALTDEAALTELGRRLARTRLERNMSQVELATQAGVGRSAVQSLERGEPVVVTTLIRVLRVLGLLDALETVVPEAGPSPLTLLQLDGRERRRAAGTRGKSGSAREPRPWSWG